LVSVFGEMTGDEVPVFAAETQEELIRRSRIGRVVSVGRSDVFGSGASGFASGSRSCRDANSRPSSLRNSMRGLERRVRRSAAMSDARAVQC
jgi:hypothetical protein